jgi:ATP-dependent Zn protease
MYRWLLYNKEVWGFENINGKGYVVTFKDKARLVKFGKTGEEVLFLRGKKVYRTAYGRKMGNNTYWFAVGQDGYWYNFVLGDLDAKREMLDIEPIDRDVRMMYVAMSKNVEERFNKPSFLDKYGTYLASGIIILLLLGSMWFLLNKMSTNLSQSQVYDEQRQKVDLQIVQELKGITIAFEQLNAQSGIRPVQVS